MIEHTIKRLLSGKEFSFLTRLREQFPRAEVFLVGGIIRDTILGRASKDYDFVVRNVPLNALHAFLKQRGWVDLVGKHFGVLKFIPRSLKHKAEGVQLAEPFDIALPRTEHALMTGGYRDVRVQSNPRLPVEDDLSRRDFTINALAYNVTTSELIDRFGGLKDLAAKKIRTVGKPDERFREDYSRLLRALRFACQLDFTIEPNTWQALKQKMTRINQQQAGVFTVPRETIAKELAKSFVANPARAFELCDSSVATKQLMPELLKMKKCPQPKNFHSEGDVWKHTRLCLKNLQSKKFQQKFKTTILPAELAFATLFHDIGKPYTIERKDRLRFNNHDTVGAALARKIMERLKLSSAGVNVDWVDWLVHRHMIVTHTKHSTMKRTTLEKYFYRETNPGDLLLQLTYADIMATIPASGKPDFSDLRKLERQIAALKGTSKKTDHLPKELLSGHDIMRTLGLTPGPQIGKLKELLREEQLKGKLTTKSQALSFIKKHAYIRSHDRTKRPAPR